jgi:nucleoid-associated protein YgaU
MGRPFPSNNAIRLAWAVTVSVALAACSSSKTNNNEEAETAADEAYVEAGTDAVPTDTAEDPYASGPTSEAAPDPMAGVDTSEQPAAETNTSEQDPYASTSTTEGSSTAFSGSGSFESYSVKSGDTLMKMAFEVYGDLYQWRRILEANRDVISDPNNIPVGTQLKVERPAQAVSISRNGEAYRIQSGDTLGTISQQVYGTKSKWRDLWDNNRELIKDPNKIYAGFTLYYVPGSDNSLAKGNMSEAGADQVSRQPASAEPAAPASGTTE